VPFKRTKMLFKKRIVQFKMIEVQIRRTEMLFKMKDDRSTV